MTIQIFSTCNFYARVRMQFWFLLTGWSAQRVQEYFEWASQVVKGLRGTNSAIEEKLQQLFLERGVKL